MKFRSILFLAFCNLYFVFAGLLLIPYAGFQHDEVVFAEPIFQRGSLPQRPSVKANWGLHHNH